jgi:hypothetical protein
MLLGYSWHSLWDIESKDGNTNNNDALSAPLHNRLAQQYLCVNGWMHCNNMIAMQQFTLFYPVNIEY